MTGKTIEEYLEMSRDAGAEILWNPRIAEALYVDEGMIMEEIAEHVGVAKETVWRWINRHDIDHRHGKHPSSHVPIYLNPYGYETVIVDANTVMIHRLMMVAEHGIEAVAGMHVHHRNEIPWDNRPSNLELLSPSEHKQHHYDSQDETPPEGF